MEKIILKATSENFTEEQLKAIEKAHNSYFYASMSDSYSKECEEKKWAFETLKKAIPELDNFIPSFYPNEEDTIILYKQVGE